MKQKDKKEPHRAYRPIPVLNADVNEGLSPQEVKLRQSNGLSNKQPASNTKTERQIIKENVFTFFNLIFLVLAAALIAVGSFKNLMFLIVAAANTVVGIFQETRAKRAVDKLTLVAAGQQRVIRSGQRTAVRTDLLVRDDIVEFNIPAGVEEGMTLTVKGKGNAPRHGGVNGDLLVVIEEVKHPELIRDGNDVIYNLMLDIPTATLGGKVEVPTIDGRVRLPIQPGTQPGKVLRLRGKGLPGNGGQGDELINVMVYIPETLSDAEKSAIESLRNSPNIQPTEAEKHRIFSKLKHIFSD